VAYNLDSILRNVGSGFGKALGKDVWSGSSPFLRQSATEGSGGPFMNRFLRQSGTSASGPSPFLDGTERGMATLRGVQERVQQGAVRRFMEQSAVQQQKDAEKQQQQAAKDSQAQQVTDARVQTEESKQAKNAIEALQSTWTAPGGTPQPMPQAQPPAAPPTQQTPGPTSQPTAEGDWVSRANSQLGRAYVWGGKDPQTGFDCSGFVGWVLGTGTPESTLTLWAKGQSITSDQLQPGDLVFYNMDSSDMSVQHVAVYQGNGQVVQSGGTSRSINQASINQPIGAISGYRRL